MHISASKGAVLCDPTVQRWLYRMGRKAQESVQGIWRGWRVQGNSGVMDCGPRAREELSALLHAVIDAQSYEQAEQAPDPGRGQALVRLWGHPLGQQLGGEFDCLPVFWLSGIIVIDVSLTGGFFWGRDYDSSAANSISGKQAWDCRACTTILP